MPYVSKTAKGEAARQWLEFMSSFVPTTPDERAKTDALIIISSSFTDTGPDWNECVLFDADGKEFVRRRKTGY